MHRKRIKMQKWFVWSSMKIFCWTIDISDADICIHNNWFQHVEHIWENWHLGLLCCTRSSEPSVLKLSLINTFFYFVINFYEFSHVKCMHCMGTDTSILSSKERDSYWKLMQNYIGSDITSMVTLPVLIFEPMTMLQKMAEVCLFSCMLLLQLI